MLWLRCVLLDPTGGQREASVPTTILTFSRSAPSYYSCTHKMHIIQSASEVALEGTAVLLSRLRVKCLFLPIQPSFRSESNHSCHFSLKISFLASLQRNTYTVETSTGSIRTTRTKQEQYHLPV